MSLPPCYLPPDDDPQAPKASPPDPTRRSFLVNSATVTAALFIPPALAAAPLSAAARPVAPGPAFDDSRAMPVALHVNGRVHDLRLDPRTTLLDALREHFDLTGTKKGCDQGAC